MKMRRIFPLVLVAVLSSIQYGCFEIMDARRHMSETEALIDVHWNEQMGTAYEGLSYADSMKLDLYIPRDTTKARHLILFVHGGGWTSGSRADGELWCKYLNSLGYTAATVDYTLRAKHSNTDVNKVDSQLCAAVQAIRQYAAGHGVMLTDMAVSGFSAGGCQALLFAYKHATDQSLPVRFVFQQSGPTTFEPSTWEPGNGLHWYVNWTTGMDGTDEGASEWLSLMTGHRITVAMLRNGTAQPYIDAISPLANITPASVPTLSLYGEQDGVVPRCHGVMLDQTLSDNLVEHISLSAPNSGHSISFDSNMQEHYLEIVKSWCESKF